MSVPASIEEFCAQHGLSEYIPMMRENEVDLDVVRDLSAQDWAEMGMQPRDISKLMTACKTLPPGSFRVWGMGANPVTAAVKKAMAEKASTKPADTAPANRQAPVARFGTTANKKPPEKKVRTQQALGAKLAG
jgi:hypothetical protein